MALPELWQGRTGLLTVGALASRPVAGAGTFGMHYLDTDSGNLHVCWQTAMSPDTFGWFLVSSTPS
jgi:hypothetical protein